MFIPPDFYYRPKNEDLEKEVSREQELLKKERLSEQEARELHGLVGARRKAMIRGIALLGIVVLSVGAGAALVLSGKNQSHSEIETVDDHPLAPSSVPGKANIPGPAGHDAGQ
jgi:hypothetical protein